MAGKTLQGVKKSKPAPTKSPEKSQGNQEVIQGTPVEAGRKPKQPEPVAGLVVAPGTAVSGKGGAQIFVPKKPDHSVVAKDEVAKVPQPQKNAPVQRGRSGALGGRKLRRERGY